MGSAAERGLAAEQRVAAVLMAQGWEVLEHRWRCRHGEMDLLLHRQGRLLIVEVKCRTGAGLAFVDGPGNCLGWRQQQRLHRAFGLWLQGAPRSGGAIARWPWPWRWWLGIASSGPA